MDNLIYKTMNFLKTKDCSGCSQKYHNCYRNDDNNQYYNKSFELLKDSSDIDPNAAYQLSRFYLQGINTKVDNEKGIELIEFAASKGVLTAQKMLININKEGLFAQPKDQKKVEFWEAKIKEKKEDLTFKIYQL